MNLSTILSTVGDDNYEIQPLLDSITNINRGARGPSKVTFATDLITPGELATGQVDNVLVVISVPKQRWNDAINKIEAALPTRIEEGEAQ